MTFSICCTTFIITPLFGVISTRSFQNHVQLVSVIILISNFSFFTHKITKIEFSELPDADLPEHAEQVK